MILSPDKPNQETQAMEEITTSGGTEARSEKAGKSGNQRSISCSAVAHRKRRRKGVSARGPNLFETTLNYTMSDHDHLCEELIIEIFTRLPVKSLLRFRSLSKSLCSYITSPDFIRMHTSRSPQKVLIRHNVLSKRRNFYTLHSEDRLPLSPRRGYIGIKAVEFPSDTDCECAGSCNGIFCLFSFTDYVTFLWNPSIRRKLIVPHCPARFGRCCPGIMCPTDNPSVRIGHVNDPIGLGFGFDTINDDYKIVSLPKFGGTYARSYDARSYVYTMKSGAWCEIASPAPSFYKATSRGCFVNGALHWVVQSQVAHFYILTFNLSTHVFGEIVLPEPKWETKQLTTIQGSLAAISTNDDDSWIWVMREYKNAASWSVFFKSKTNQVIGELERVLQPTSNGDLVFGTSWYDEGFQVYDPKIRTRSRLQNLNVCSSIIDMETCVESLQLLGKGTTC